MKITVFNGSPKAKRSNTGVICDAFARGAIAAGADVENVYLAKKEIRHCLGCLCCWIKTPGVCVQKDDMRELVDKFMASDLVVLATPLYVDNVSGMTKVFLDRLCLVADPHFELDERGETTHVKSERAFPGLMVISSCGFPERSQFQVLELLFRRVVRNMRGTLVAEIYRSQGNLLGLTRIAAIQPVVSAYLETVEKAAAEIVHDGAISSETSAALDRELIPRDFYIDGANRHWDKQLAKLG